jgi:ABC-type glycerol-3-phosphate transport system substrate-binding protein
MKKRRGLHKIISVVLAGIIASTSVTVVSADESAAPSDGLQRDFNQILEEARRAQSAGIMGGSLRTDLYMYYYQTHKDKTRPDREIVIPMGTPFEVFDNEELKEGPVFTPGASFQGKDNNLIWDNDLGGFIYEFEVPQTGIYNLEFLYHTKDGNNNAYDIALMIGRSPDKLEHPFAATRSLELDKYWKNAGAIQIDSRDNHLLPQQVQHNVWITYSVKDKEGLFSQPYFFYLEQGTNYISIEGIRINGVVFNSMTFKNYPELLPYSQLKPSGSEISNTDRLPTTFKNDIGSSTILRQGETPLWRSSSELVPSYDRSTYQVSPSHAVKMRYNTVGGGGVWQKAGQSLSWEFEAPADGWYRFSAKVKQSTLRGFSAHRRVLINGVVPVKEFDAVAFPYSTRWYQQSFTDANGDDIYVHLKAGQNTITLEAVPGDIGTTLQALEADLFTLNYYYRRILMITGPNPDEFNPYYVDEQIPELIDEFKRIRDSLRSHKSDLEQLTTGSEAATLETMAVILDRCIDNPDRIPMRMQSLKDNIGSLSAWIRSAARQPLELDYIEIATVHESFGRANVNFFRQLLFLWQGFIGSFFEDYTRLDDGEGLNIWVALGRDQALALKHLVDSLYNSDESNKPVAINLVQGGILEASLAGKGPEVALFIGGDFPVQLAARNLTVDISQFPDYQKIVDERFAEQLPIFFSYLDGVYGLPLSQNFPMMFYRTDILEDLELAPPLCWEEFIDAVAVLNRQYLEIGLMPPTSNLTSQIFETGETFTFLQLQTGQNFYVDAEIPGLGLVRNGKTTFDSEASVEAFTKWTRFYTVYQFPQTFDPFTRFRTGEMPIVIMPYGFYNMVNAAAPEIRGLWDFRHIPGTWRFDDDGERFLDISASSSASGGIIFNKTQDQESAWEFLKWLTSEEIQTQFGGIMESMLGPLGRYDTANNNALLNLAWSERELRRLIQQRDALVEIPMIPANYAATRHIKNAFRAVVNENQFPRFALASYNRDINAEIERKNRELASHQQKR